MWQDTRHRISRRRLLRGLGAGTILFSPFVRNRLADAAPRGNFLFIATPNGFVRSKFGGEGSGSNWSFKPSLAPLDPFKQDVALIRALAARHDQPVPLSEIHAQLLARAIELGLGEADNSAIIEAWGWRNGECRMRNAE